LEVTMTLLLLGLALVLGYAAGIGAALLYLPRPLVEPYVATFLLVGLAVVAGLGGVALLTRRLSERTDGRDEAQLPAQDAGGPSCDPSSSEATAVSATSPLVNARPQGAPLAGPPCGLRAQELRRILQEGRVDLFVRPLVCVPPELFAPYRALTRLRGLDDRHLEPASYLPTAAGCGLLGLIDQIFILRAVHAIRQAAADGHEVRLFCALTPASLGSPDVLAEIADFLAEHADLAERLVVEIDRVRLSRSSDQALARLRRLGLRLSLRRLMPAGVDARLLVRRGISFVRLEQPRDALLHDRARLESEILALRRSLDDAGITLVLDQPDERPRLVELSDRPIALARGARPTGARSSAA
jgi:cyclic-di-GMP phosphodiesterase TipF (flagellum assembly factor)